jgi:hypothetical protein
MHKKVVLAFMPIVYLRKARGPRYMVGTEKEMQGIIAFIDTGARRRATR